MSGISERDTNPYVGPRSIQPGEPLYGREREVNDLYDRLQARRIVVLHSPSGAGKSSLVQAGLIPKLREGKFDVWKPIRVNLDPADLGVSTSVNRFVLSVMLSLEEELPSEHRRSPATLSQLTLAQYLTSRPRRKKQAARPVVLLFDQFEEVLTVAPYAVEAKFAFFEQLGEALANKQYWALFIIREDFLAAFAPYRDHIPTAMLNTFRLDLLGLDGAREAALQPALAGGRTFPGVDLLVRDLSMVQVQQSDGSFASEQGLHVEPVQLQVVCRRLWAAMPDDDLTIDPEDIEKYASVSESLGAYYAQSVASVAGGDASIERALREWVGSKLIVDGIRSQVRQDVGSSAGLANDLIHALLRTYLVRIEQRAGANWFELSHDRLVAPVLRNNEVWERENLHPVQVQARLWENHQRDNGLLLSQRALLKATIWAKTNAERLTASEREFLRSSRELHRRERNQRLRQSAATGVSIIVAITMGVLVKWARGQQHEAEEAQRLAELARHEAEQLSDALQEQLVDLHAQTAKTMSLTPGQQAPALAMALGVLESGKQLSASREASIFAATRSLHDAFELPGHTDNIVDLAFAPDAKLFASASRDDRVIVWSAEAPHAPRATLTAHGADVTHVEFAATGEHLLTLGDDHKAFVWRVDALEREPAREPGCPVRAARFALDGRSVALACMGEAEVCLWSLADDRQQCIELDAEVDALELSPTHVLARSGERLLLAELSGSTPPVQLEGHTRAINAFGFSRDGSKIVSGDAAGVVKLWSSPGAGLLATLEDELGDIELARFSPDGTQLLVVGETPSPALWQLDEQFAKTRLIGHDTQITDAAFSNTGSLIATVGYDQTLRLWEAESARMRVALGSPMAARRVVFSPSDTTLATGELAGTTAPMVRVWNVESIARDVRVSDPQRVGAVALSGDAGRAAMSEAERVRVWDTQSGQVVRELEHAGVVQLQLSASGRKLATQGTKGWRVWDLDSGELQTELPDAVTAVGFAGREETLVIADVLDRVGPWTELDKLDKLDAPQQNYYAKLAISSTGMLAAARRKGFVTLWSSVSGQKRGDFDRTANYVIDALSFSPSGRFLAITSKQRRVWVLDVQDGTVHEFLALDPVVGAIGFSPDERQLIVGSGDSVALWSLASGEPELISTIGAHEHRVDAAVFSADGRTALTASTDGSVIAWPTTGEARRALACEVARHSPIAYHEALGSCR